VFVKKKNWIRPPARFVDLVKIQSKLPMVEIGEFDLPTWMLSKHGVYNCAATQGFIQVVEINLVPLGYSATSIHLKVSS
jgi:hypothetical protein